MRGSTRVRALAVALLTGLVLLGATGPAAAHAALISSDPADGATVGTPPRQIRLTFSQPVQESFSTVTVTGPGGRRWQRGPARSDGAVVTVPLQPLRPAGRYIVAYRVLSADGHPVDGTIAFTLTAPGPAAAPTPSPQPVARNERASGSEMPVWPWVAGAMLLAGAGTVLARRLGRR